MDDRKIIEELEVTGTCGAVKDRSLILKAVRDDTAVERSIVCIDAYCTLRRIDDPVDRDLGTIDRYITILGIKNDTSVSGKRLHVISDVAVCNDDAVAGELGSGDRQTAVCGVESIRNDIAC